MNDSLAKLRRFIMERFNDEELENLCFDYFPEVANNFAEGITKGNKVRTLIDYCQRRDRLSDLLGALERERPSQYREALASIQSTEGPVERASAALLAMSQVTVEDPPPWSKAGVAAFELVNTKDGKAVLKDLLLIVLDCGVSELPKMVEAAAPVPQNIYKVTLTPTVKEYDVRKREFGVPAPISFVKEEVEQFVVELRSTEPQWYKFQFLVRWYDSTKPTELNELWSPELRVEFKPSVEELLKDHHLPD